MCALNPRMLRPILSGDPDANRYIAAVQQADGESLEPAIRKAITDFIVGCKKDGIWDAISSSCILMGARTLSGALTPLRGPTLTNNNFVSGDYDSRKTGLLGNGTNKRLSVSLPVGIAEDDNSKSGLVTEIPAGSEFRGIVGATSITGIGVAGLLNFMTFRSANSTTTNRSFGSLPILFGVSRTSSASFTSYINTSTASHTLTSSGGSTSSYVVFATPVGAANTFPGRIAFYHIGRGLDVLLLHDRVFDLYNAIDAAIP